MLTTESGIQQVGGVWLPGHETHLVAWMKKKNEVVDGKLTYQHHKLRAAMRWVTGFRTAVDIGAHCGLWSMHLARQFARVEAFEPVELHRECFMRNVPRLDQAQVRLHAMALGLAPGRVSIHTAPSSSGDSWVDGDGDIPMQRLDDQGLEEVDFIKLDCEGYELFALQGGEQLLRRCQPTVIVEQKPGRAQKFGLPERGAVDYLQSLGATLRQELGGDYILSWSH